jgi:NifU-like protein involved in Fe-S cluster formation
MSDLYHNRVLELAANIPGLEPLNTVDASVEKVSRICGSTVRVDIRLNEAGTHIEAISVDPKACALGQAATAILAESALGAEVGEVIAARDALKAMLRENAAPPSGRFWELRHLAGVADYPARHTSTRLAFEAAVEAINEALAKRAATKVSL